MNEKEITQFILKHRYVFPYIQGIFIGALTFGQAILHPEYNQLSVLIGSAIWFFAGLLVVNQFEKQAIKKYWKVIR